MTRYCSHLFYTLSDPSSEVCHISYLSFLHSVVDFFVLLELLQLCFNQHLSDVHHLLHRQRETLHRETELLLQQHTHMCSHTTVSDLGNRRFSTLDSVFTIQSTSSCPPCTFHRALCGSRLHSVRLLVT